jgi:hypothetical protein
MKQFFILANPGVRDRAIKAIIDAPEGYQVTISEPARTGEQNAAMWPILQAFSEQLQWPVNGQMVHMTPDEWKDVLSCAFDQEVPRVAMGLQGGMVMLGRRTSQMGKRQFSEFLEFLHATAAQRGVVVHRDEIPA